MNRRFLFNAGGKSEAGGSGSTKTKARGTATKATNSEQTKSDLPQASADGKLAKLKGYQTKEQVAAWKKKWLLGIYAVSVGGHVGYFKMPDFDEINFGYSRFEQDKVLEMWRSFAEATWLGGSDEILTNATLFAGAVKILQRKVEGMEAELVDL